MHQMASKPLLLCSKDTGSLTHISQSAQIDHRFCCEPFPWEASFLVSLSVNLPIILSAARSSSLTLILCLLYLLCVSYFVSERYFCWRFTCLHSFQPRASIHYNLGSPELCSRFTQDRSDVFSYCSDVWLSSMQHDAFSGHKQTEYFQQPSKERD